MMTITDNDILELGISPETCCEWVSKSFLMKSSSVLPPKTSIHLHEMDFFNTMPCLLPEEYDMFSVKIVSRIVLQKPALKSTILLYRASTGERLAIIEADWITRMRTGAVACLAARTLRNSKTRIYSFMGLGSTAYATMDCMEGMIRKENAEVRLLKYKDQAEKFAEHYRGIKFSLVDNTDELIDNADVIISCITHTDEIICPDLSLFKPGVLVVPVHTRGFQNCDTVFDKVFADDTGHVRGFVNFGKFKQFNEIGDVLGGSVPGRESDSERILSYNIGLGLHDAYFAYMIYNMILQN